MDITFLLCNSNFVFIFDFKTCRDLEIRVRGHSRSLKVVKWYHSIDWVGFPKCSIETMSVKRTVFEIFDFKNAATLITGLGVRQGHWKCHHAIERIGLPIYVL